MGERLDDDDDAEHSSPRRRCGDADLHRRAAEGHQQQLGAGVPGPGGDERHAGRGGAGAAAPAVAGQTLRIDFDGSLDPASGLTGSAFLVSMSDGDYDDRDIRGTGQVAVAGSSVTVMLAAGVRGDELASVDYTRPASAWLRGAASGNPPVLSFDHFRVETVDDVTPPSLVRTVIAQTSSSPATSKMSLY